MILLVDGSNIVAGGGKTHLLELLQHGMPHQHGFEKVVVYGNGYVMESISNKEWLVKITPSLFSYGYVGRMLWQFFLRSKPVNGIWFVPGAGKAPGHYVTMCQNLLPIERKERDRFFFSVTWVRLVILGWLHNKAFKRARGVIFFNQYCFNALPQSTQMSLKRKAFIPHGVSDMFKPQSMLPIHDTLKLIYVSTIDEYKHQWKIARAVGELNNEKIKIEIDFIGAANSVSVNRLDPYLSDSIRYHGPVAYEELPNWYSRADAFIFGSTCETFGMVLLEAMASGLPVLCSRYSSMPETLGENALYFDPLDHQDVKRVIRMVYTDRSLLTELRSKGMVYAQQFTWNQTSSKTFEFLAACARQERN